MRASVTTLEKCTSGAHILGKAGGFAITLNKKLLEIPLHAMIIL